MVQLLGLILISFAITSLFMVPFIDFLFYVKQRFEKKAAVPPASSEYPIHNKIMKGDVKTPSGGGVLLIAILTILSLIYAYFGGLKETIYLKILLFTLLSFGGLGLVDDIRWLVTKRKGKILGLGSKYIFFVQLILATIIASMLYFLVGLNNVYISGIGNLVIGAWYIPMAAFVIIAFSNAYNISDGLDGLSTGLLTICLFALLTLASTSLNLNLAAFVGIWVGSLFAYLYFNVYPARIFLGDAGGFAFGATLAVVGLLTGKLLALGIIGGVYIIIVASSLLQILSKKFLKRKLFPVAPLHMYFRYIGWEEPKIVMRFWLAGGIFAILGLWLALLSSSL
jgi:phospho-N-acetylmuramoyl-pentapeptide-transferase